MKLKSKAVYPSKTTINLVLREKPKSAPEKLLLLGFVLVLLVGLFIKFLVIDRLAAVREAEDGYKAAQTELNELKKKNESYNDVLGDYLKYSKTWMNEEENVLVERTKILDMINDIILPQAVLESMTVYNDSMTIIVSGLNLNELSALIENLESSDIVSNVTIQKAGSKETASTLVIKIEKSKTEKGGK